MTAYPRLSDEEYAKALGQASGAFRDITMCFNRYEHKDFISGAVLECIKVCEDFGMRVRGKDHTIGLKPSERKNPRYLG